MDSKQRQEGASKRGRGGGGGRRPRFNHQMTRRKGLNKKAGALSAMCGAEVAVICYGPHGGPPTTYPDNLYAVDATLRRFDALDEAAKDRRRLNLASYAANPKKPVTVAVMKKQKQQELASVSPSSWTTTTDKMPPPRVGGGKQRPALWHPDLDKCSKEVLRGLVAHLEKRKQMVMSLAAEKRAAEAAAEPLDLELRLGFGAWSSRC